MPLGGPETGTDLLRLLFVEPSIYVFVSEENLDLCVWIYLVVVGDNHPWEEISTIGSRCSHGPTPSSTPDRTHLPDFLKIKKS